MTTASERLRLLYEVSRRLSTFNDLDELLRYATGQARDLFGADGCGVLLLDPSKTEFYFPVASQSASRQVTEAKLAEIRFPADRGIAGWVLANDQSTQVRDTATDARFYGGVDEATAMETRALLCAPMRSHSGNLGVIEVINPAAEGTQEDMEFLEALAADIAVAIENASMHRQLRGEIGSLRQALRVAGGLLATVGVLLVIGNVFGRLAYGLPLSGVLGQPSAWAALLLVVAGIVLVVLSRSAAAPRSASAW